MNSPEEQMTPDEFKRRMELHHANADGDTEEAHMDADNLMCRLLRQLGYGEGVDLFEDMHKWYN